MRDGCTSAQGCEVIPDGTVDQNAVAAAKLARIWLADESKAGWLVYQVTGMPDCRYLNPRPALCVTGTVLDSSGAPDATFNPTQQYLNITPLLPDEIKDSFAEGELPPMLVQPDYRARRTIAGTTGRAEYTFDALFGIPEDGLVYRDTFEGVFDVHDLLGSSEDPIAFPRCGGGTLTTNSRTAPAWDPVVNISELAPTVGGPNVNHLTTPVSIDAANPRYVSMLLNDACSNPTRLAGGRGSAFVYGLELSPSIAANQPGQWIWYDSRYAALMRTLGRDFNAHLYTYACNVYGATTGPTPLSSQTCYQLQKDWPVVYDKFKKCVAATDQPKNSSGSEACNSFETQFAPFYNAVLAAPLNGDPAVTTIDPFNYVGELKARLMVLSYVYMTQFKPSLKPGGFDNPNPAN